MGKAREGRDAIPGPSLPQRDRRGWLALKYREFPQDSLIHVPASGLDGCKNNQDLLIHVPALGLNGHTKTQDSLIYVAVLVWDGHTKTQDLLFHIPALGLDGHRKTRTPFFMFQPQRGMDKNP